MTLSGFLSLAVQSVTAPRDVARLLLSLRLGREALLTALALVIVLNAFVFSLSLLITPAPTALGPMADPMIFSLMQAAALIGTIAAFQITGKMIGGQAGFADIAILMIWLQALRVLVQAGLLVMLPLAPFLGSLVMMVASALGVWILIHFVDEAHEFNSLMKALMVLILGVLGMAVALTVLLSMLGLTPTGNLANV